MNTSAEYRSKADYLYGTMVYHTPDEEQVLDDIKRKIDALNGEKNTLVAHREHLSGTEKGAITRRIGAIDDKIRVLQGQRPKAHLHAGKLLEWVVAEVGVIALGYHDTCEQFKKNAEESDLLYLMQWKAREIAQKRGAAESARRFNHMLLDTIQKKLNVGEPPANTVNTDWLSAQTDLTVHMVATAIEETAREAKAWDLNTVSLFNSTSPMSNLIELGEFEGRFNFFKRELPTITKRAEHFVNRYGEPDPRKELIALVEQMPIEQVKNLLVRYADDTL